METLSHVPLFSYMFRTAVKESFNGVIPKEVEIKAVNLIKDMADAEKRWTKYVALGMLGFSEENINIFVENRANSVCRNLGLPKIYDTKNKPDSLNKILQTALKGGDYESRTNIFDVNATEYSKGTIIDDY